MTKMVKTLYVRELRKDEFAALGKLMVDVYSNLAGFPGPDKQPGYYEMLRNIGRFSEKNDARVLVAISADDDLVGGIVYFGDMAEYGSGGTATTVKNASGIRLLGVSAQARGMGAGKALARACIQLAKDKGHSHVVLHTTQPMQVAWSLYEKLGFERSKDLDFVQEGLPVYGFRLWLAGT
jgi:GNAT superfamily N-acetyltransferase